MKKLLLAITGLLAFTLLRAQEEDDLLNMLDSQETDKPSYVYATFKGTRLINLPTVEVMGKNTLEFRIAHRFGDFETEGSGFTLFGLDGPVALYLQFDYSLTDRLSVGLGRTNNQKLVDGNVKYQILKQTTDNRMPITMTYLGKMNVTHEPKKNADGRYDDFLNRMSYVNQLMVARKFGSRFSLQLDIAHIHRNLVRFREEANDQIALGLSGRVKITKRVALTAEYAKSLNRMENFYDHFGFGVDIETGGHVFQLFLVNSFEVNEAQFLPTNNREFGEGMFRFGFNVSRVFSL